MEKSDSTKELATALCIVQGKLTGAKKDSENPYFKSKYADLASVWDACRNLLSENGLSVIQTNSPSGETTMILDTTLLHNSGEWIGGSLEVPLSKSDPQGLGSAMTYARRYALAAIIGICPEDDDAEAATKRDVKPAESKDTRVHWCEEHGTAFFMKGKLKSYAHPIKDNTGNDTGQWCYEPSAKPPPDDTTAKSDAPKPETDSNVLKPVETLQDYCKKLGWGTTAWHEYLRINFNAAKLKDLTDEQVIEAASNLKAMVQVKETGEESEIIKEATE